MPRRTDSHIIGDTAVNQVVGVCYACGWACERVRDDYGEDIIVQTALNEEVDPYRILIQCKGTRDISQYRRKEGGYSYSFPSDTVRKWVRSNALAVVILWDITKVSGVCASLANLKERQILEHGSLSVTFDETHIFDVTLAKKTAWDARLSHYNTLLLESADEDEQAEWLKDSEHESQTKFIAFDFLRRAGIILTGSDGKITLEQSVVEYFGNTLTNMLSDEGPRTSEEAIYSASRRAGMHAFSAYMEERFEVGAPRQLIMLCGTEIAHLYEFMAGIPPERRRRPGEVTLAVEGELRVYAPSVEQLRSGIDRMVLKAEPAVVIVDGRGDDFAQATGGNGLYTVEWREYGAETFTHWRAGLLDNHSHGRVKIPYHEDGIVVQRHECLTAADVKVILEAYLIGNSRPANYSWRDITEMLD
jgi:hypothetical protein